ncbi:hypothetical protein SAY86_021060 [Trapa natans]|uniref:Uncharacterized protein n=1 Tax=Trapa natans TaxID=22666 RepID=A0AAN7MYG9_TRANT|nr:hypothetical protein SAY86_021060 [Trapa natans]
MPESRDRLARPIDITVAFVGRRSAILDAPSDEGIWSFILYEHPSRQRTPMVQLGRGAARGTGGFGRSAFGAPGTPNSRGRNFSGSPLARWESASKAGNEGRRRRRKRPTNRVLPSWYPRSPSGDITPVFMALQRRRSQMGDVEGHKVCAPMPTDPSLQLLGHPFERSASLVTPSPSVQKKRCPRVGEVPKIMTYLANMLSEIDSSDFLTPQNKLLNQIDKVEKEVMEELRKLKRTPGAKKAEREKRVRTLLSVR